jgi:hypothetical protein
VLEMRRRPSAARALPLLLAKDRKESACHVAAYPLGFEKMANGAVPPLERGVQHATCVECAACAVRGDPMTETQTETYDLDRV